MRTRKIDINLTSITNTVQFTVAHFSKRVPIFVILFILFNFQDIIARFMMYNDNNNYSLVKKVQIHRIGRISPVGVNPNVVVVVVVHVLFKSVGKQVSSEHIFGRRKR